jgi:hypothetical protein
MRIVCAAENSSIYSLEWLKILTWFLFFRRIAKDEWDYTTYLSIKINNSLAKNSIKDIIDAVCSSMGIQPCINQELNLTPANGKTCLQLVHTEKWFCDFRVQRCFAVRCTISADWR